MRIIDAQIHTWGSGLPSNAAHWPITSFTPAEAIKLMDEAGVHGAVIHPPHWDPNADDMAFQAVRDYPGRFAIMGSVPLDPASAPRIATWRDQPGMLGLRWTFLHEPARTMLRDGSLEWLWTAAEKAGVPIAMMATDSLDAVGRIAEAHPGLRLTIDHMGGRGGFETRKDAASMDDHMAALVALARLPNIAVKATGAPGYCAAPYPFAPMHPYLRQIFDAFGPARMFWGTDISKMPCSWTDCVRMFAEELPWLKGDDLALVMGEGLCRWWGWER